MRAFAYAALRLLPWILLGFILTLLWAALLPWIYQHLLHDSVFRLETSIFGEIRRAHEQLNAGPRAYTAIGGHAVACFLLITPVMVTMAFVKEQGMYLKRSLSFLFGAFLVLQMLYLWPTAVADALYGYQPRDPIGETIDRERERLDGAVRGSRRLGCEWVGIWCDEPEQPPQPPR